MTPSSSRTLLESRKVLVVDDHPGLAEMFADALRDAAAEPVVVHHAIGALETLRRQRVDAIVSDLKMPGMSGFDLMKVIRSSRAARVRAVPAIAISGEADWRFQDPFEAARAGFDFHLLKPVEPSTLVEMVRQVMLWRRRRTP